MRLTASSRSWFEQAPSGLAIDPAGRDPALYVIEPGRKGKLYRLLINDTRAHSVKKEHPDKVRGKAGSNGIEGAPQSAWPPMCDWPSDGNRGLLCVTDRPMSIAVCCV